MLRFVVSGLWLQLGFLDVFKAKPIVLQCFRRWGVVLREGNSCEQDLGGPGMFRLSPGLELRGAACRCHVLNAWG